LILSQFCAKIKSVGSREISPMLYRTGKSGQPKAGCPDENRGTPILYRGPVRATVTNRVAPNETTKRLGTYF